MHVSGVDVDTLTLVRKDYEKIGIYEVKVIGSSFDLNLSVSFLLFISTRPRVVLVAQ